jgi:nitrogen fixation/metabolism regulation signal transduction histidine kinase
MMRYRMRRRNPRPRIDVHNHQEKLSTRLQDTRGFGHRLGDSGAREMIDRGRTDDAVIGAGGERQLVTIDASQTGAGVEIVVDDDGNGLAEGMREAVLQRGVRADEAAPGSGLGLAIVRDLAEVYGGSISLDASPAGGLRARLRLPA